VFDPRGGRVATVSRWLSGRFGLLLGYELLLVTAGLLTYRWARVQVDGQVADAFRNARLVRAIESGLGLHWEETIQDVFLKFEFLIPFVNRYYAFIHFPVTGLVLIALYVACHDRYRWVRRRMLLVTAAGLMIHAAFPLAPPRMFPGVGYVDTLKVYGPYIYESDTVRQVANQYAAMPSLHVGWAVLLAAAVFPLRLTVLRVVAVGHAVMTTFVVVVTANHWWLDAAAAVGLIVIADSVIRHMFEERGDQLDEADPDERFDGEPVPAHAGALRPVLTAGRFRTAPAASFIGPAMEAIEHPERVPAGVPHRARHAATGTTSPRAASPPADP
jgi:hypothetical protein